MRHLLGFMCVLALGVMGCSETSGTGGSGGTAGVGGDGGMGGVGGDGGSAGMGGSGGDGGMAGDGGEGGTGGSSGTGGMAGDGGAGGSMSGVFPCTEQGIRDAIAVGGGPHTFDSNGPTTVVTEAEIVIDNDAILDGEGNLSVEGSVTNHSSHSIFEVAVGVTAELHGFVITHGPVSESMWWGAGGILNEGTLAIANTTVSGNHGVAVYCGARPPCATAGGGVFNAPSGVLTLTDSIVSGNYADDGGGIFNSGTLTVMNSIVSGNSAAVAYPGMGGGIYNGGSFVVGGPAGPNMLTMTSSVVSGNDADSGGGILNQGTLGAATLVLTNSTVSGNSAANDGGGILNYGTVAATSSTVSGNVATNGSGLFDAHNFIIDVVTLSKSIIDDDCLIAAPLVSDGYNIESPGDTCGFDHGTDLVNITEGQLDLGPLADNGGPTMTHALLPGSVAIDHIPAIDCEVTEDERGEPRPGGTMCDVGAFEVQP